MAGNAEFVPDLDYSPDRPNRWQLQDAARHLLPHDNRLSCCHRARARGPGGQLKQIEVYQTHDGGAFIGGLMKCASVWVCPVCAKKIGETRRKKLRKAIDHAHQRKMGVSLITLTFPHGQRHGSTLNHSLDGQAVALRRMKSRRDYREWKSKYNYHGEVRALELVHGKNGWHPHTHALTFTKIPLRGSELTRARRELFLMWARACLYAGLPAPSYKHGTTIQAANKAADYVAKWGMVEEMAAPELKQGRGGGRNPWQLLYDSMNGDKRAAWLFREYAKEIKGKRQLFWSRGLADSLGVDDELTDQEVMALEPEAVKIAVIDHETWSMVLRIKARQKVVECAREGIDALIQYLHWIHDKVPRPKYFSGATTNSWSLERKWRAVS